MRIRVFHIRAIDPEPGESECNAFLAGHHVVQVDRQFVPAGQDSFWSICVVWLQRAESQSPMQRKGKVDYREVLGQQDFKVYAELRALRKELADREGVPAYALFTNEQLAAIVQRRVTTAAGLLAVDGVGTARVEKYGPRFLQVMRQHAAVDAGSGAS